MQKEKNLKVKRKRRKIKNESVIIRCIRKNIKTRTKFIRKLKIS